MSQLGQAAPTPLLLLLLCPAPGFASGTAWHSSSCPHLCLQNLHLQNLRVLFWMRTAGLLSPCPAQLSSSSPEVAAQQRPSLPPPPRKLIPCSGTSPGAPALTQGPRLKLQTSPSTPTAAAARSPHQLDWKMIQQPIIYCWLALPRDVAMPWRVVPACPAQRAADDTGLC